MKIITIIFLLGPYLPYKSSPLKLITSPDRGGLVLIGGYRYEDRTYNSEILELRGTSGFNAEWKKIGSLRLNNSAKLSEQFAVIPLSEEITDCQGTIFSFKVGQ